MNKKPALWFCWRCDEYTYWKSGECQRCLQVRQSKIRAWLIGVACVFAFVWSIMKIYWGSR